MYCTVYTTGNGSVIYINPNCNMKLIYEYLRVVTEVPDSSKMLVSAKQFAVVLGKRIWPCLAQKEIDLCTESGRLLGIYEAPCSASGLQYFKPRSNYFVLTFDYVEDSGELYNPQSLMHHTNYDFEAVFSRIKKVFGIPPSEPIDDNDALLIFEHLLLAYQQRPQQFSDSNVSSPSKKSEKKKRSHSVTSLKGKQLLESSVLMQWREEKRVKMAVSRMEESESSMERRKSSVVRSSIDNEYKIEGTTIRESEEATPEERPDERIDSKKTKGFQKRTSQTTGKKGSKKQPKKSGKDAKEDAQVQQAVPSNSNILLTPKPSFRGLLTESALQLYPSNAGSGDNLKTLFRSKSSLFAKSDFHDPIEPIPRRPHDSIRQFFMDHPTDVTDLPKPPAADSNSDVTEKVTKVRKKKKCPGLKRKKIVVSRRSHPKKLR